MKMSFVFIFGCLGALAPEIVRLYALRDDPGRFTWSWFYIIVSILFAGLGGLVALGLPATNWYGAFYAGISTPVIITTAAKKIRNAPRSKKGVQLAGQRMSRLDSFLNAL